MNEGFYILHETSLKFIHKGPVHNTTVGSGEWLGAVRQQVIAWIKVGHNIMTPYGVTKPQWKHVQEHLYISDIAGSEYTMEPVLNDHWVWWSLNKVAIRNREKCDFLWTLASNVDLYAFGKITPFSQTGSKAKRYDTCNVDDILN